MINHWNKLPVEMLDCDGSDWMSPNQDWIPSGRDAVAEHKLLGLVKGQLDEMIWPIQKSDKMIL